MSEITCPYCEFTCKIPKDNEEKIECPDCGRIFLYMPNTARHGTIDYRPSPKINDKCKQMSELKATSSGEIRSRNDLLGYWWYEKSEADKAIAELERQIEFLKITHNACGNCNECANGMGKVFDEEFDKLKAQKAQADKVIAELKDKCEMHNFFWEGCGFAERGFKNTIAVSEAFDNLDTENRALKRALWLMTAEWAEGMGLASSNIAIKLSFKERFVYNDEANREKDIEKYRHRQVVFCKYADYCRAKAEECK